MKSHFPHFPSPLQTQLGSLHNQPSFHWESLRSKQYITYTIGYNRFHEYITSTGSYEGSTYFHFRELSANVWYHLSFTWNRESRLYRLYIDGVLDSEENQGESNPNLKPTTEPEFFIGKRHSSSPDALLWMSDWAMLSQTLSKDEISLLKGTTMLPELLPLSACNQQSNYVIILTTYTHINIYPTSSFNPVAVISYTGV